MITCDFCDEVIHEGDLCKECHDMYLRTLEDMYLHGMTVIHTDENDRQTHIPFEDFKTKDS
jgi:hypothetical protein